METQRTLGTQRDQPPQGLSLLHTLRVHSDVILRVEWSGDGATLASTSVDRTIGLWDGAKGELRRRLEGHHQGVNQVAFAPDQNWMASCSYDRSIRVWNLDTGQTIRVLSGHNDDVSGIALSPNGSLLASASADATIRLWRTDTWETCQVLDRHKSNVYRVAWSPDGRWLASCSKDGRTIVWDSKTWEPHQETVLGRSNRPTSVAWSRDGRTLVVPTWGQTIHVLVESNNAVILEGHTGVVRSASFSCDGRLLASSSGDDTVRLWRTDPWEEVAQICEPASNYWPQGIAFHPFEPILATFGEKDRVIRLWRVDTDALLGVAPAEERCVYRNAKVVLLGDTGVGKSGLRLALTGEPYRPTDSTYGRRVWTLETIEKDLDGRRETRETLLWDMAGQPGFRLIHQLHLDEVAVALLVFDARQPTGDPLAAVRHWDRALRESRRREGDSAVPLRKFLVLARADVQGAAISQDRIEAARRECGFDGLFETSAKMGSGIRELGEAIRQSIAWEAMPEVNSPKLFEKVKQFLLDEKGCGRLLALEKDLYRDFCAAHPEETSADLRATFQTCVTRLENRDLIRSLSFGGLVLLQPELLDAYASAMVLEVQKEKDPRRQGAMAEEDALAGRFRMPDDERASDKDQERWILIHTVEELLRHQLVLREHADDGTYLVFPSQFNRDWPEASDPEGKAVIVRFQGPVQNIYATLAVRLAHTGLFQTRRGEMWRNAVVYTADVGGECGLFLREFGDGAGELTMFFRASADGSRPTPQTQYQFEGFVLSHLARRALANSIQIRRLCVCATCGVAVPDGYVEKRRERGFDWIECACGTRVSLVEPQALIQAQLQRVLTMEISADRQRDDDIGGTVLKGKQAVDEYDVFLCHNSRDRDAVKAIGQQLKQRGIRPWLDEWDLRPGSVWVDELETIIGKVKSAAVFVGPNGTGPWEQMEIRALLRTFVKGGLRVIPVVLPLAQHEPNWSGFMQDFHRVDFRIAEPNPMQQLCWGITGQRPD